MKPERKKDLDAYYREAATWAQDREARDQRSRRIAWWAAGGASFVAIAEAFALVALAPLKTVEPYTLLVDRQTGYVEALKPLERQAIAPDAALTRSFLVQYVIARESFDLGSVKANYRKAALWSAPEARATYIAATQATNPASPLASLPRTAEIEVQVKSVSSLGPATSLVRFRTHRADLAASPATDQDWAAVISYRYSGDPMTVQDRLINPLGFQVTRYRRDAESIPDIAPAAPVMPVPTAAAPAALVAQPLPSVPTASAPPVIPMARAGASAKKP
jgi:type IV secretion system protein VirB8